MKHTELNELLRNDRLTYPLKPLRVLADAGFAHLQPTDFEVFVMEIFEGLGFSGTLTPPTGDGGIDIFLESDEGTIIVQCKRYDDNQAIGSKELREFLGAIVHSKAIHGYFVSTSSFSSQATEFCSDHDNITLIDGECLRKLFFFSTMLSLSEYGTSKQKDQRRDGYFWPVLYRFEAESLWLKYITELRKLQEEFKPKY